MTENTSTACDNLGDKDNTNDDSILTDEENPKDCSSTVDSEKSEDSVTEHQKLDGTKSDQSIVEDPYAYIDRNGFTSEKFKIEIRGLPKFYGIGELKKLLNKKLQLGSNKIKIPKTRSDWVYVCFRNEEDRESAMKIINGLEWKKKKLTAHIAKPAPDPLVKRRIEAQEGDSKKVKVEDTRTQLEKIKDSTVPLWRLCYDEQVVHKTGIIKDTLIKIVDDIEKKNTLFKRYFSAGRVENDGFPIKVDTILRSPRFNGYRNKCEFTIGIDDETGEKTVGMRIGSYATGTTAVAPIYNLPHVPDIMKQAVKVVEGFVKSSPLDVFDPETYKGHWRQLTVRYCFKTNELMLIVGIHPQDLSKEDLSMFKEQLRELVTSGDGQKLNVTSLYYEETSKRQKDEEVHMELVYGQPMISERLCGLRFDISPQSFFQVNTHGAEVLCREVGRVLGLTLDTTLVDICCGTGSIGLTLAKRCGQVLGLESNPKAIADARRNAALNSITNCEFFCGPAEEILQSVVNRAKYANVAAVVDPPRAGLRQNAVTMLRRISKITRIAFICCNIKSAAKNIVDLARTESKTLVGAPFLPLNVIPVDLFPHTSHCEVIVYMKRM